MFKEEFDTKKRYIWKKRDVVFEMTDPIGIHLDVATFCSPLSTKLLRNQYIGSIYALKIVLEKRSNIAIYGNIWK